MSGLPRAVESVSLSVPLSRSNPGFSIPTQYFKKQHLHMGPMRITKVQLLSSGVVKL